MVMEASPDSTLVVVEAYLLLQVLEVALDAPSELGGFDGVAIDVSAGSVESQYLVGASSPSGHFSGHGSARRHASGSAAA
jgi:hypothetical protein